MMHGDIDCKCESSAEMLIEHSLLQLDLLVLYYIILYYIILYYIIFRPVNQEYIAQIKIECCFYIPSALSLAAMEPSGNGLAKVPTKMQTTATQDYENYTMLSIMI